MMRAVQYEYLFMDRKRIGSNIEAIMKDRKCTKVTLSQAMNISRPTLDAFLRGDIHNAGKYDEYIRRLLVYMQLTDTVLDNYKTLPDVKKMRCNSVQKEVVRKGIQGMDIPYIIGKTYRTALNECKKVIQSGGDGFALSFTVPDAAKILGELTEDYPDLYIGVADVTNREEASLAVDSGARFVFTNFVVKEVGSFCKERDVFCVMGVTTLTEAYNAQTFGSDVVNLYPYEAIHPAMIQAMETALPKLELMATMGAEEAEQHKDEFFATLIR
ncbi:MAG: bifunctional 4-hydroxy-2-oxoglutarate aldolase/2-dehydro-3-deoxy-phosphogluconate aldolase [Lachnospiraceae bacterium]|nr:bifunctional 4-hydroxy-2-oxoglutarate aldolase/2-dehydro-3-deoxy-phosphogluconate aldolase [Lachnospiraceae bacterium]